MVGWETRARSTAGGTSTSTGRGGRDHGRGDRGVELIDEVAKRRGGGGVELVTEAEQERGELLDEVRKRMAQDIVVGGVSS